MESDEERNSLSQWTFLFSRGPRRPSRVGKSRRVAGSRTKDELRDRIEPPLRSRWTALGTRTYAVMGSPSSYRLCLSRARAFLLFIPRSLRPHRRRSESREILAWESWEPPREQRTLDSGCDGSVDFAIYGSRRKASPPRREPSPFPLWARPVNRKP